MERGKRIVGIYLNVELLIYIYTFITLSMIGFNVVCLLQRKLNKHQLNRKQLQLNAVINEELHRIESGDEISGEHIDYLINKLKHIPYFMAFNEAISGFENKKILQKYFYNITLVFNTLAQIYNKKNITQRTYFANMIAKYAINKENADDFIVCIMLENVIDKSTYLRESALKVLYSYKSENKVFIAMEKMSRNKIYHHTKLITDGLLTFKGNHDELISMLYNNFHMFNTNYKVAIINYINYKSSSYTVKFFDILKQNKENKEVNIAIIRYFRKHYNPICTSLLIEYIDKYRTAEKDWEYAAIAVSALGECKTDEVRPIFLDCLKSPNWYVRYNAADSIISLDITDEEIKSIYDSNDKYAIEILNYKINKRKIKYARSTESYRDSLIIH